MFPLACPLRLCVGPVDLFMLEPTYTLRVSVNVYTSYPSVDIYDASVQDLEVWLFRATAGYLIKQGLFVLTLIFIALFQRR